jgi:hypothetical protein
MKPSMTNFDPQGDEPRGLSRTIIDRQRSRCIFDVIRPFKNYYARIKPIALFVPLLLLAACGLSEKEKTALLQVQKAKEDSIRTAEIQRLKDAAQYRSSLSDSLSAYNTLVARQQKDLAQLRTAIYAAKDALSELQQSHSDQSPQVQRQEMKIQALLVQQISLQASLEHNQAEMTQIRSQLTTAKR